MRPQPGPSYGLLTLGSSGYSSESASCVLVARRELFGPKIPKRERRDLFTPSAFAVSNEMRHRDPEQSHWLALHSQLVEQREKGTYQCLGILDRCRSGDSTRHQLKIIPAEFQCDRFARDLQFDQALRYLFREVLQ